MNKDGSITIVNPAVNPNRIIAETDNCISNYVPLAALTVAQQPFRPYPGSQLYSDLKEQGMIEEPKTTSEWIGFNYDNYMPWLDNKTYEFMRNLTFYSSKMSYVGRTVYGKILNKISIARGRMGIYSVPIERRMVSWTTQ